MTRFGVAAIAAVLTAGCLGPTPYQVRGATGGYQERAVGEHRWYVEFFGNGYTTRDTVMAYWLYRCAELTSQKGFEYFVLLSKAPPPDAAAPSGADGDRVLARGAAAAPIIVFTPGTSVTTWSARGVIELRNEPPPDDDRPSFEAEELLKMLAPAVRQAMQSGENVILPRELVSPEHPRRAGSDGVNLDDLEALLPKD